MREGVYVGKHTFFRKDGVMIKKVFRRKTREGIEDVERRLQEIDKLGRLDNDIVDVKINRRTNEVELFRWY